MCQVRGQYIHIDVSGVLCVCVGITIGRTQTCEDELRGTIRRKMRSMSLSSLVNRGGKGQEDAGESSPGQKKSFRNKFGSVSKKRG